MSSALAIPGKPLRIPVFHEASSTASDVWNWVATNIIVSVKTPITGESTTNAQRRGYTALPDSSKVEVAVRPVVVVRRPDVSLEGTMRKIEAANQSWSRRLIALDAAHVVDPSSLHSLVNILVLSDAQHWPNPAVFPGECGGLRVEWVEGRRQTIYEVDEEGQIYAAHFDFASGAEADIETSLAEEAEAFLRGHLHD